MHERVWLSTNNICVRTLKFEFHVIVKCKKILIFFQCLIINVKTILSLKAIEQQAAGQILPRQPWFALIHLGCPPVSYSQSREGGREERASRRPCGALHPRQMWEGESPGEGKLGCVDGKKVDFLPKDYWGARALLGGRSGQ